MALIEKYVNPFTDFGFKKLFGAEPNKDLPIYFEMPNFTKTGEELETIYDNWLYVLKNLPKLESRPRKLQERVFQKLFEVTELAKFAPEERDLYEESLKVYPDLKNVNDTTFTEGRAEGKIEGRMGDIIKALRRGKRTLEEIAEDF